MQRKTILPVEVSYGGNNADTFALLEDASTVTLIDQEFADSFPLFGPSHPLCLQGANENEIHQQNDSCVVSFTLHSKNSNKHFQLRHVITA
ncbi:hypothetical protein HHI36_016763 [Cryptolaemus montrouzieri]|uniref:Uncharacterized protein n=1 Tax=Cryptolaemus montrouzieri TaxID=559131 RepID=A0ABD2NL11_9CUCU